MLKRYLMYYSNMRNLQVNAIILLCIGAALLILSMTSPEAQGCDSCLPASKSAMGYATVFGIIAAILMGGGALSFAMDRKREYLKTHGYL
jgi:hypothetical protein